MDLLVFCIHCSLSLFCSDHLQGRHYLCGRQTYLRGRQTIENHLVHTGTNSYRRITYIMTSSTPPCSFFRGLYFRGSRSVRENLHPVKISRYTVLLLRMAKWTMYTTITWVNHTSSCSCHGSEKMLVNAVVVLESTQKRIFGWQIIQVEGQDITFSVLY